MLGGIIDFIVSGVVVTVIILLLLLGISVMAREDGGTADAYLGESQGLLSDISALRGNPALSTSLYVLGGLLVLAGILHMVRRKKQV
jgi:hypothetical protein